MNTMDMCAPGVMRRVEPAFSPMDEGCRLIDAKLRSIDARMLDDSRKWLIKRLAVMPAMWRKHITAEHARRGGLTAQAANLWLLNMTAQAAGRLPLSASDWDIREAAIEAARVAVDLAREDIKGGASKGTFDEREIKVR